MTIIYGTTGDDQDFGFYKGTIGDDIFYMYEGDDWMSGSAGSDSYFGGAGWDALNYEQQSSGVIINNTDAEIDGLAAFSVLKSAGGTDTLDSVENFHGSSFDDTFYLGDEGGNVFARAGDDIIYAGVNGATIFAGSGNDTIIGDAFSRLSYYDDTYDAAGLQLNGITVVYSGLYDGSVTDDGWGDTDTFTGISEISGSEFADTFIGAGGDVIFKGNGGNDTIFGGAGRNYLFGGAGNDYVSGGDGHDDIYGGAGDDTLDGGAGEDDLNYDDDVNGGGIFGVTVNLATGTATDGFGDTDTISGFENVAGTEFGDDLTGDNGDNGLHGYGGNDTISGGGGDDDLFGYGGNDTLEGGAGNDTLDGGAGDDNLYGGDGLDEITFWGTTTGISVNITSLGAGTVFHGSGDTDAFTGIEFIGGTEQADTLNGATATHSLNFSGGGGGDIIIGGSGDDWFSPGEGADTIIGGAGFDRIAYNGWVSGTPEDTYEGWSSETTGGTAVTGGIVATFTSADAGSVTDWNGDIDTFIEIESIRGTEFADIILGFDGYQNLQGAAGDDILNGGSGDDILSGGQGDDILDGGTGEDWVAYHRDRGSYPGPTTGVIVNLETGVATDQYGTTDTLTSIENVKGSQLNDIITGSELSNILVGEGGSDIIYGGAGNDLIYGGDGDDVIYAGFDDNIIDAGAGDDSLYLGRGGADTLDGGSGNDTLIADLTLHTADFDATLDLAAGLVWTPQYPAAVDTITNIENIEVWGAYSVVVIGDSGDNILSTDTGNDRLEGGAGDDTLDGGDGDDQIWGGSGNDILNGGAGTDTVLYDNDIEEGGSFGVIVNLETGETIDGFGHTDEIFEFENIVGTSLDDTLIGDSGANRIDARDGNDIVFGGGGDDNLSVGSGTNSIYGGDGNDYISGFDGDDTIYGGEGNDFIQAMAGIDYIDGGTDLSGADHDTLSYSSEEATTGISVNFQSKGTGTATDWSGATDDFFGIEQVLGTEFDDTMVGSIYDEILHGEGGNDTLSGGAGDDWLKGGTGEDSLSGGDGTDTIWYYDSLVGITATFSSEGTGSVLDGLGGNDTFSGIEKVDGSSFDDWFFGSAGNDEFQGRDGSDYLSGGGGDDRLYGGVGDDTLMGAEGNDWLLPGEGSDSISGGDGFDRIAFWSAEEWFGATQGINVIFTSVGTGTLIDAWGNTDTFTGIEGIVGTGFDDILTGSDGNEEFQGQGGNDVLDGRAGDDQLVGSGGNDILIGGDGWDVARYDYDDTNGGTQGIIASLLANVAIDTFGDIDTLSGIEEISGSVFGDVIIGDAGANTLSGFAGADTLAGGAGNDQLYGGAGADLVFGGIGDDILYGASTGVDGADTDILLGQEGNDTLYGGGGSDVLLGGDDNDTLFGGDATDSLDGGAGADILIGGGGTDILLGGLGADVFLFASPSEGPDLIKDFASGEDGIALIATNFGLTPTGGSLAGTGIFQSGVGLPADFGDPGTPVVYYETSSNALLVDVTGGDSSDAVLIAILETGTLTESDVFLL